MKRARERVRDDGALVGDVASRVSGALGLDSTNRTLGRSVVIAALDANIAAISAVATTTNGTSGDSDSMDLGTDVVAAAGAAAAYDARGGDSTSAGEAAFRKAAKGYGPLGDDMLSDVYRKVTTRLRGALVQLQAVQEEEQSGGLGAEGDGDAEDGGLAGFGKAERLSGFGVGAALKGGLVKRHTFQVRYINRSQFVR